MTANGLQSGELMFHLPLVPIILMPPHQVKLALVPCTGLGVSQNVVRYFCISPGVLRLHGCVATVWMGKIYMPQLLYAVIRGLRTKPWMSSRSRRPQSCPWLPHPLNQNTPSYPFPFSLVPLSPDLPLSLFPWCYSWKVRVQPYSANCLYKLSLESERFLLKKITFCKIAHFSRRLAQVPCNRCHKDAIKHTCDREGWLWGLWWPPHVVGGSGGWLLSAFRDGKREQW